MAISELKYYSPTITHDKIFVSIGLTPLIALIYVSVEPAVTQNCVASVTRFLFMTLRLMNNCKEF